MRTSTHFSGGSAARAGEVPGGGGGGKMGHGLGMGSNGFGAKSSRPNAVAAAVAAPPRKPAGPGELSEAKLNAHNAAQQLSCKGLSIAEEAGDVARW